MTPPTTFALQPNYYFSSGCPILHCKNYNTWIDNYNFGESSSWSFLQQKIHFKILYIHVSQQSKSRGLGGGEPVGAHHALALDLQLAAELERELGELGEQVGRALRDLHSVRLARRLHPTRRVHRVAEQTISAIFAYLTVRLVVRRLSNWASSKNILFENVRV